MYRLIALLIGYVIGTIQTAYYVGRLHGIDIRDHGSKSAGMTNVTRTLGKKMGAVVFLVDICKCFAAFIIATLLFGGDGDFPGIYAGIGTVLGHCFPVLLKFRGGKGVACALALILMNGWLPAIIAFSFGVVIVAVTRYISLASLVITLVTPILMLIFGFGTEAIVLMSALAVLIWFMHRENIKRLIRGEERKFLSKETKKETE
ncbi:MAG: glycerol-3-phosphate 1-O-acyltransferase PlsY [Defluviitaleaceae bacterium]|nr:glycerol-3-phosphate 1-O-acyltransferase PlsY [Defluviitaleaceae bacterium]